MTAARAVQPKTWHCVVCDKYTHVTVQVSGPVSVRFPCCDTHDQNDVVIGFQAVLEAVVEGMRDGRLEVEIIDIEWIE